VLLGNVKREMHVVIFDTCGFGLRMVILLFMVCWAVGILLNGQTARTDLSFVMLVTRLAPHVRFESRMWRDSVSCFAAVFMSCHIYSALDMQHAGLPISSLSYRYVSECQTGGYLCVLTEYSCTVPNVLGGFYRRSLSEHTTRWKKGIAPHKERKNA
jgi:hypothetical protein